MWILGCFIPNNLFHLFSLCISCPTGPMEEKNFLWYLPCNSLGQFLWGNLIGGDSSDCLCITDIEVAACVHCAIERTALLLTMLCNESTELVSCQSYKKWQIWQIYVLSYFMGFLGYEYECMWECYHHQCNLCLHCVFRDKLIDIMAIYFYSQVLLVVNAVLSLIRLWHYFYVFGANFLGPNLYLCYSNRFCISA